MTSSRLRSAFGLCCISLLVAGSRAQAADDAPLSLPALQAKAEAGDVQAWVGLGQRYQWGSIGAEQDYAKARFWYEKAAAKGNGHAAFQLAQFARNGTDGKKPDAAEAFKWMQQAAENGFVDAQLAVGVMHQNAEGTRKNLVEAFRWYLKAAERDDLEAQYLVGVAFAEGLGTKPDLLAAAHWFAKAQIDHGDAAHRFRELLEAHPDLHAKAEAQAPAATQQLIAKATKGDASAQLALSELYAEGRGGLLPNNAAALKWLRAAAQGGNATAQYRLGHRIANYDAGEGATGAAEWFKKAAAQKVPEAFFGLGMLYFTGQEVEKSPVEALKWFRGASDLGHIEATEKIGFIYLHGEEGVPKDVKESLRWFTEAANRGHTPSMNAIAQIVLARGPERDPALARTWLARSIELGNPRAKRALEALDAAENDAKLVAQIPPSVTGKTRDLFMSALRGNAEAQFKLGGIYSTGNAEGLPKDPAEKVKWYRLAGEQGHPYAQGNLGHLLREGDGVPRDDVEGFYWTKRAAEQQDVYAHSLGMLYRDGTGTAKNTAEAAKWFKVAAERNHNGSRIELATLLLAGDGVAKNEAEAVALLLSAANADSAGAMWRLSQLYARGVDGAAPDPAQAHAWLVKAADNRHPEAKAQLAKLAAQIPSSVTSKTRDLFARALRDDAEAQFQLGVLYGTGNAEGLPKNPAEQVKWLELAAERNHEAARQRLGQLLFDKATADVKASRTTVALEGFEKAAGYGHAAAMTSLGALHMSGSLEKNDPAAARRWFEKAVAAGDVRANEGLRLLATHEAKSAKQGLFSAALKAYKEQNFEAARTGWEKGAALADANAMFNLGVLHERGEGVPQDYVAARTWYEKAQAAGHAKAGDAAQRVMGYTVGLDELARGNAESKAGNKEKALEWYLKAVELGNVVAMVSVGSIYAEGDGVDKDPRKAIEWFEKAAAKGDAFAQFLAQTTKDTLPLLELAESQKKMRELRDKIDGVSNEKTPAPVGPKTGIKDLRKNSPWSPDEVLAALTEGADHTVLAEAIKQDKTAPTFTSLELKRLLNTPAGRRVESFTPLSKTLHDHARQGAGDWTFAMGKAAAEARRKQTGRAPSIIDTPELRAKAAAGDAAALFELIMLPEASLKLGPTPMISAEDLQRKIIEANHVPAFYFAADAFRYNVDPTKKDPVRYAEYLRKSAESGDPRGMRELGMLFMASGETAVATNYAEAEYWLIEAAARAPEGTMEDVNYNPGRDVAFLYSFAISHGGPVMWPLSRPDKATLRWARELIRRGGPLADVANVNLDALEREQRVKNLRAQLAALPPEVPLWSAAEVAQLDQAARGGDTAAAFRLGEAYASGRGVRQHDARAVEYYRLAAAQGLTPAMRALAWHYENGFGVNKDAAESRAWRERADALGNRAGQETAGAEVLRQQAEAGDAKAMLGYARKLAEGQKPEAFEWLKKAADNGQPDAMLLMAGQLMATDKAAAIQWMKRAADAGGLEAKFRLGSAMFQGNELPKDQAGGLKLMTEAADGGFAPAQFELGRALVVGGPGLPAQPAGGVDLLRKAAAQWMPAAMVVLGEIHEKGVPGIPANPREALTWYEQALKAGVQEVRPAVERLRATLGGKTPPRDK